MGEVASIARSWVLSVDATTIQALGEVLMVQGDAQCILFALVVLTGIRLPSDTGECVWCRPDMALMLHTMAILAGAPIKVFNHGKIQRDFTHIDDIV